MQFSNWLKEASYFTQWGKYRWSDFLRFSPSPRSSPRSTEARVKVRRPLPFHQHAKIGFSVTNDFFHRRNAIKDLPPAVLPERNHALFGGFFDDLPTAHAIM